jgi:signal peptidase II
MLYVYITIKLLILDIAIKDYIEDRFHSNTRKEVLGGRITLGKLHNKGAMLGLLKDYPKVLKAFGLAAVIFLIISQFITVKKGKPLVRTGCALLLAGAAGNLYDRLKRGYVVDYFSIKLKPIRNVYFNLADIFILIGSLFILVFQRRSN